MKIEEIYNFAREFLRRSEIEYEPFTGVIKTSIKVYDPFGSLYEIVQTLNENSYLYPLYMGELERRAKNGKK
jgi:hypothetical protein